MAITAREKQLPIVFLEASTIVSLFMWSHCGHAAIHVGPLAVLPVEFHIFTGKCLSLPVNTVLHIPEHLIHVFGTTLMLSTVSILLPAANYPICRAVHCLLCLMFPLTPV